jgi:predicted amidohydrolase YtcJ
MLALLLALQAPLAPAHLVIDNAQIWSDGQVGFARFAAVRDGRFIHVGEPVAELVGPNTVRVDAGGRVVIPGLIDSHIHMISGGLGLTQINLRAAVSRDDFIRRVREWTREVPRGRWLLGGRWSVESWAVREEPRKEWIDFATPNTPAYLTRMDGHTALVNSAALKIAGITKDGPPDPPGGVIERDPQTGEPTGILREKAMGLVSRHIPPVSVDDKLAALKLAIREAHAHGITAVSDIPGLGDLPVYERLAAEPELSLRFFLYPTGGDWAAAAKRVRAFKGKHMAVEVKGFKAYFDGTLGSRTAMMRQPFLGNAEGKEDWRGLPMPIAVDGTFLRDARAADAAGLQSIVHAIGDEANHILLNQLSEAYKDVRAARNRSEHAQHLLPQDIPRFARLGVIPSMQPYHKADDGRYAESYIGAERSRSSYAFKSLLDAGAMLAFGSDWPVVSINPFLGVEAAVTGKTMDGRYWQIQENITVAEALRCYTSHAAYASFAEREIGKIAPGYRADFVVLDQSPFGQGVKWESIRPLWVYLEGRRVHSGEVRMAREASMLPVNAEPSSCSACAH